MSSIPSNNMDDIRAPLLDTSPIPSSISHSTSSHSFPTSATSTSIATSTSTSIATSTSTSTSTSTPITNPVIRSQSANFYDYKDDGMGTGIGSASTGDMKQMSETSSQEENTPYYQRNYERIIQKLKAEREFELKKNREKKVLYTTSQQRWILSLGCLVVSLVITMLVFLFYPRLPTWDISSMSVIKYNPSKFDSTAVFHISLSASIYNHNFLTMGIESMEINFYHNTAYLGHSNGGVGRFGSRSTSHLILDGNFGRLDASVYEPIDAELTANNGVMSLIMEAKIKTNEVFRLTDLQVTCSILTWINQTATTGPSLAHIQSCNCSHTVLSRSHHPRRGGK